MTTTTLHATPYNIDAAGFYFTNEKDYVAKSSTHFDRHGNHVDEYEIQFIDGEYAQLFTACGISQANLSTWFDDIEPLTDHEKVSIFYLLTNGYDLSSALDKLDEPCITEETLKNAASDLFDECYAHEIPDSIKCYIDYDKFAHDCEISGDMCEFKYVGTTYTCTNSNSI